MPKLPSPCLGVCKFRHAGHCIACSMTRDQKSLSKKLKKPKQQEAFITLLLHQQNDLAQNGLAKFPAWPRAYLRRCARKGVQPPRKLAGG